MDFRLPKEERLCSRKTLGELFISGESLLVYPLKVVFIKSNSSEDIQNQAAFAVSKRNFKRAVKRNLIKRRMREAYRLNKQVLQGDLAAKNLQTSIMFIYVGKEVLEYATIEKSMILAFKKVLAKLQ
jgi:ribonuclease P protein component